MGAAELRPCLGQSGLGTRRSYKWTGIVPPVTGVLAAACDLSSLPSPMTGVRNGLRGQQALACAMKRSNGGALVHRQNLPRWVSLTVHSAQSSSPIVKSSAMTYELFFFFF